MGQPTGYLHRQLGGHTSASTIDPSPLFPFGHGLSYTSFRYDELATSRTEIPIDGDIEVSCLVTNTGHRAGAEVVQLYLHDPVASVTRPQRQLLGFARVELDAGQQARVVSRCTPTAPPSPAATSSASSSRESSTCSSARPASSCPCTPKSQ
jgi:beta-xylosidase